MPNQDPNPALLVFLREESQEIRAKSFGPGKNRRELVREMNRQTLRQARATGLPLRVVRGREQVGTSFAERFTRAIEKVFDEGFHSVIAIGNDCPGLGAPHFQRALQALSRGEPVLGPARDGGIYLLGLHRRHFDRTWFACLPWQRPQLCQALQAGLPSVCLLPEEWDADDLYSLAQAVRDVQDPRWVRRLQSLIRRAASSFTDLSIPVLNAGCSTVHGLRAPPVRYSRPG